MRPRHVRCLERADRRASSRVGKRVAAASELANRRRGARRILWICRREHCGVSSQSDIHHTARTVPPNRGERSDSGGGMVNRAKPNREMRRCFDDRCDRSAACNARGDASQPGAGPSRCAREQFARAGQAERCRGDFRATRGRGGTTWLRQARRKRGRVSRARVRHGKE